MESGKGACVAVIFSSVLMPESETVRLSQVARCDVLNLISELL